MSYESVIAEEVVEVVYKAEEYESSEDPPMEQWSSLLFEVVEENKKKLLYQKGRYDPGSPEICSKYIPMSTSSVFRHVYYNYPSVEDPGITKALLAPEPPIIYPDDGQELYLAVCKDMVQCPIKIFYKGLLEDEIDLRYYCANPKGVRAMAMALKFNRTVKVLNLTDNFLNDDASYHLGDMVMMNYTLQELNLSGCRIGASGVRKLCAGLPSNKTLNCLNLNKNQLGNDGLEYIAKAIFRGSDIQKLYLSYNNIGAKGALALAEAFETRNKLIILDLSWNNLYEPGGTYNLLSMLGQSKCLQELYLSWNSLAGPRMGTGIRNVAKAANLKHLDVSYNKLSANAITNISRGLIKAKKLVTLDLSYNPMTPNDAFAILLKMKTPAVKVQKILMENVSVTGEFLVVLKEIQQLKIRHNLVVTYGGVISKPKFVGMDARELILNRIDYLAQKPKKNPVDIALLVYQLVRDKNYLMQAKDFWQVIKRSGAPLDNDLVEELVNIFSGSRIPKEKILDLHLLADYMHRKWPDRKLPPTPPPELVSEPGPAVVLDPKGKDKKEKGKK